MRISYDPLWKLLIDRKLKKTELSRKADFCSTTLAKMNKGELVHLKVIHNICEFLQCRIEDVIEFLPDKKKV